MIINNIYMIAAITEKTRAIGKNGDMIYHLKEDLKYFRKTTTGHTIVMGSKTYYSFPNGALPNRKNIVLTRGDKTFPDAEAIHSKEKVLEYAINNPSEEIFIVGGDNIYNQFIGNASKLYVTLIDEEHPVDADSFFPEIDKEIWKAVLISDYVISTNSPNYRYVIYERK